MGMFCRTFNEQGSSLNSDDCPLCHTSGASFLWLCKLLSGSRAAMWSLALMVLASSLTGKAVWSSSLRNPSVLHSVGLCGCAQPSVHPQGTNTYIHENPGRTQREALSGGDLGLSLTKRVCHLDMKEDRLMQRREKSDSQKGHKI